MPPDTLHCYALGRDAPEAPKAYIISPSEDYPNARLLCGPSRLSWHLSRSHASGEANGESGPFVELLDPFDCTPAPGKAHPPCPVSTPFLDSSYKYTNGLMSSAVAISRGMILV